MNDPRSCVQRFLGQAGALLFLGSMVGGGYVALAKTGKIDVDAHSTVAAHLNAMLGAFWLFAVAWSVPHLGFGATGLRRLAWLDRSGFADGPGLKISQRRKEKKSGRTWLGREDSNLHRPH